MLTLLIDIGNTRTKWRAVDLERGFGDQDAQGAAPHAERTKLGERWRSLPVQAAWIANVSEADALAAVRAMLEETDAPTRSAIEVSVLVAVAEQSGVINCYREPERLGADRWAALIGARALFPGQNAVIASLGTATTVDVLRADGRFTGGAILPGIALMRHALARKTAGLPLARGHYRALARNTDDAITSGILHAQAGAIERVMREAGFVAASQEGQKKAPEERANEALCVLTGGDAALIPARLPFYSVIADNLVLRGLLAVAQESALSRAKP
jgi:type III pantothenate kinase